MSDSELRTLERSIDTLKDSFDKRVNDLKAGFDRVERIEREVKAGTFGSDPEALKNLRRRLDEVEAASKRLPQGLRGLESIGAQFVESGAFKAWRPGSQSSSMALEVKSFFAERKANELTGASLGSVGSYIYPAQRVPGIIGPPVTRWHVRDLLPLLPVSVGAVEYVRQSSSTNNAAVQNESTIAAKAQTLLGFESVTSAVRTIAHWLPAARQIISDAPALQAYIDAFLTAGLLDKEDDEILNGTGGATSLDGLLTDSDIQTITQGASPSVADDNYADVIRRAMTLLEIAKYSASGIILHPNDWSAIELLKDGDGRYIWARVQETGQRRLWGLPVVTTISIDEGQFCVGDFAQAAALWDRQQASVRVSDQHGDYFIKNLVAILAEERVTFTVFRPEAICLGTFSGAGS